MDYGTARQLLIAQGTPDPAQAEHFLTRLSHGQPPVPGQSTSVLLALKVVFEASRGEATLDRPLVYALHMLAFESRRLFEAGKQRGATWTPLLDDDLTRMAIAVQSIFSGTWQG